MGKFILFSAVSAVWSIRAHGVVRPPRSTAGVFLPAVPGFASPFVFLSVAPCATFLHRRPSATPVRHRVPPPLRNSVHSHVAARIPFVTASDLGRPVHRLAHHPSRPGFSPSIFSRTHVLALLASCAVPRCR